MRFRLLAAAVAVSVLAPSLAVAGPAAAAPRAAVKVTLSALPASADVGQKVLVSGVATPARKHGKKVPVTVSVQRRYATGAWATVARKRTTRAGTYAVRVPLVQGGTTSFRVVRAGGRTSPARSLAVYAWLDLVDLPLVTGGASAVEMRRVARIGGRSFPGSIEFPGGIGVTVIKTAGLCTTFEAWTGFLDTERDGLPDTADAVADFNTGSGMEHRYHVPAGPAVKLTHPLTGRPYVAVYLGLEDAPGTRAVLGSPRVRCNATTLPEVTLDEIGA